MKLRHYETFYLLDPDLNEEQREAVLEKIKEIITTDGGEIVAVDNWPLKKLAYRVNKKTHGYYVVIEYGAKADVIQEITRNLRLDETVMKFLTSKLDDEFDLSKIMADKQAKAEARAKELAAAEGARHERDNRED
jgi:small subunit ribosomal protein S6